MPPANGVLKHNSSPHAAINLIEQVFGILTVALLIIVISRGGTEGRNSVWLLLCAAVFLVGYYLAWILYYQGNVSTWLLVLGIATMPLQNTGQPKPERLVPISARLVPVPSESG